MGFCLLFPMSSSLEPTSGFYLVIEQSAIACQYKPLQCTENDLYEDHDVTWLYLGACRCVSQSYGKTPWQVCEMGLIWKMSITMAESLSMYVYIVYSIAYKVQYSRILTCTNAQPHFYIHIWKMQGVLLDSLEHTTPASLEWGQALPKLLVEWLHWVRVRSVPVQYT